MKKVLALLFFTVAVLAIGCGGGGSSTPTPTPTPTPAPTPQQLAVCAVVHHPAKPDTCASTVDIGGSQTFSVTNSTDPVTWSSSGPGSISSGGVYLAPSTFPSPNAVTITATSGTKTGTDSISVVYPNNNGDFQSGLIKFGTSGGNVKDVTANPNDPNAGCCIGTLGSLITDGTNFFILSNNHVLARSGQATSGENIDQPGPPATNLPLGCFTQASHVADFTKQAPLKPTAGTAPAGDCRGSTAPICGLAPSNVDAAIAQILPGTVDLSGSILDLGAATPTSIGDAPPSSQILLTPVPGQGVAKSGRTTGLTCSTIDTVSQDIVVSYDSSCGGSKAFDAVFRNQVFVKGGNFSAGGDSGSLIVSSNTAEPLALLFAGSDVDTIGNPIQEVLNQFAAGTPAVAPTFIPGNPDHPVSCAPTAQLQSTKIGAGQSTAISSNQRQAILRIRDRHASQLMASEPAIRSTDVGASTDSPGEGALVIKMASLPKTRIAPVIEGVRTKVEFSDGVEVPMLTIQKVNEATAVKQARVNELMGEHGIQGVGVGRSDDNPTETAIVVFTIKGEPHPPIPALIDGIRTRVVDSERFRAFGWNSQLEPKPTACGKARTAAKKN